MIPISVAIFLFIELATVAYFDIKTRKVRNSWFLMNVCLYPLLLFLFQDTYYFNLKSLVIPLGWIVLGFVLFRFKVMGAGDSKYLCSFFLLLPYKEQEEMLFFLIVVTAIVGGLFFSSNLWKNSDAIIRHMKCYNFLAIGQYFGSRFCYAPVVLMSYVSFLPNHYGFF